MFRERGSAVATLAVAVSLVLIACGAALAGVTFVYENGVTLGASTYNYGGHLAHYWYWDPAGPGWILDDRLHPDPRDATLNCNVALCDGLDTTYLWSRLTAGPTNGSTFSRAKLIPSPGWDARPVIGEWRAWFNLDVGVLQERKLSVGNGYDVSLDGNEAWYFTVEFKDGLSGPVYSAISGDMRVS